MRHSRGCCCLRGSWNSSEIEIVAMCRTRKKTRRKVCSALHSASSVHFARSESVDASFPKNGSRVPSPRRKESDFQTQSGKQSIFRWKWESVGSAGLGDERRDISISLVNSLWHPAYVSLGTVCNVANGRRGGIEKENGGTKPPELPE